MLPIDDSYHILKAEEMVEILQTLKPKIVIPMHYRINGLEPNPENPKNLAGIDHYIGGLTNVTKLPGNTKEISVSSIPEQMQYLVFKHSPRVK